jgi:hypothetical protein
MLFIFIVAIQPTSRLPDCITARLPTAALLLDHGLAALALAAFVRATVALQTPNKFVMDYKVQEYLEGGGTQWRDVRAESYYTIATFYRTFHVSSQPAATDVTVVCDPI